LNGVAQPQVQTLASWLQAEQGAWEQVEGLVAQITPEEASVVGYYPGWSIKDMLAHLAGWLASAGMVLERVDPDFDDSDLSIDQKNEIFVEANRDQPLSVVLGEAIIARNRMLQELRALGRIPEWAEEAVHKAGPDHYLEHATRLREWISELRRNHDSESGTDRHAAITLSEREHPRPEGVGKEVGMTKGSLTALADEHLRLALDNPSNGRSAHTIYGGQANVLRQTLIALVAGQKLGNHPNPGEATVQVLRGRVTLASDGESIDGSEGDLLVVPQRRHSLEALENSVVLLTVGGHH
jgi:quercetin dioxygenase-like cupin family protein